MRGGASTFGGCGGGDLGLGMAAAKGLLSDVPGATGPI